MSLNIHNKNYQPILIKIATLILFLGLTVILRADSSNPLDSLKRVFAFYKIPADLQEEWLDELRILDDNQSSIAFRSALEEVNEELVIFLREERQNSKSQKIGLKKKLDQVSKNIFQKVDQGIQSAEVITSLELAKAAEKKGNYEKAISHYEKATSVLTTQKKWAKIAEIEEDIADIYAVRLNSPEKALEKLENVKIILRELKAGEQLRKVDNKIVNLKKRLNITSKEASGIARLDKPTTSSPPVTPIRTPPPLQIDVPELSKEIKKQEEQLAKKQEEIEESSKEMKTLNKQLEKAREDNNLAEIAILNKRSQNLEKELQANKRAFKEAKELLYSQKELLGLKESELEAHAKAHRILYSGLGISALLAVSMFFLYRSKRKDHKKLTLAYQNLEVAQSELKNAEQRIKGLLDQQVSGAVAAELLATNGQQKKERRFVCIMFLDIRNFTPFVESKTPEEIIEYQNNVLGFMMEKVTEHGGIVNTVLGDGFMATFGAPISAGNDCLQAYKAAVEIMQIVKEKSNKGLIPPTKIGIGLHAGNVVAGNVGTKTRKQYLITGNAVIIASRLEQLNKEYGSTLIISREVVEQLPSAMNLPKYFDQVKVKGRSRPVQIAKFA